MCETEKSITPKQRECIECIVQHLDWSQQKIADEIGCHVNSVQKWNKQELFRQELDKRLHMVFKDGAKIALKRMLDIAANGNDTNAFNACRFLLENGGYKEAEQIEIGGGLDISIDYGD